MKGLAPHTLQVFEAVSKLDCIKPYLLVGGTALSLQMGTRQSEDLDFISKIQREEILIKKPHKHLFMRQFFVDQPGLEPGTSRL